MRSMADKWEMERLFNKQSWEKGYLGGRVRRMGNYRLATLHEPAN